MPLLALNVWYMGAVIANSNMIDAQRQTTIIWSSAGQLYYVQKSVQSLIIDELLVNAWPMSTHSPAIFTLLLSWQEPELMLMQFHWCRWTYFRSSICTCCQSSKPSVHKTWHQTVIHIFAKFAIKRPLKILIDLKVITTVGILSS